MDMQAIQNFLSTTATELGIKILAAIAFWIIGRWLIGRVVDLMQAAMGRNHVDPTLTKYLGSIVAVMLNIALVLGILGYFGIQTTSFAALIAGAGVAIGAAWSGMLGNFAAGAFMLVLRPFKVGDFVGSRRHGRHGQGAGPVRHHHHHAGQRGHARRQRQGLRRRDQQLLGQPGAARRAHRAAGRRRRRAGRHRALQGRRGRRSPMSCRARRPKSTCSTSTWSAR